MNDIGEPAHAVRRKTRVIDEQSNALLDLVARPKRGATARSSTPAAPGSPSSTHALRPSAPASSRPRPAHRRTVHEGRRIRLSGVLEVLGVAHSTRYLQIIVATLEDKGAHLAATEQPADASTAVGKAFLDMLGVVAEFETTLRRERQTEGIAAAKQRSAHRGRPPRIHLQAIQHRLASGLPLTQVARERGISRGTTCKARDAMTDGARRGFGRAQVPPGARAHEGMAAPVHPPEVPGSAGEGGPRGRAPCPVGRPAEH